MVGRHAVLSAALGICALAGVVRAQEGFIGEIRMFAGNFEPRTWAFCDGRLLSIAQYSALFSILGVTYGGDGRTTFALPDLRGRVPLHPGMGSGLTTRELGEKGGTEAVTLSTSQLPVHSHAATTTVSADSGVGTSDSPKGRLPARNASATPSYSSTATTAISGVTTTVAQSGGSQPVSVVQPFTAVNFIICLEGIFPARN